MLITAKLRKGQRKAIKVTCKMHHKTRYIAYDETIGLHANISRAVRKFCSDNFISGNFVQWRENDVNYYIKSSVYNTIEIGPHIEIP